AYRRPAEFSELQRYVDIVNKRLSSRQASFEDVMIAGYTAALCSPGFLYLEEAPVPLTSFALASRLSYFLWNAPPDPELRKLAAADALRNPAVLRAQTNRLLDDSRSKQF